MSLDPDLLYQMLGARIRAAREKLRPRMSQERLAANLAISRASVVNIEAGRQRPPLHLLWRIAAELGTEVALLIPKHDEYVATEEDAVQLDDAAVAQIAAAAEGDPKARRLLALFVSQARASTKKEE